MGDHHGGAASAIEFGSDATVTRSLVGLMSARDVQLTDAAAGATIGPKAFVGFVATPKVTVQEGDKVLFGTRQALAFSVIAGAAFAIVRQLIRRLPPGLGPNPS